MTSGPYRVTPKVNLSFLFYVFAVECPVTSKDFSTRIFWPMNTKIDLGTAKDIVC